MLINYALAIVLEREWSWMNRSLLTGPIRQLPVHGIQCGSSADSEDSDERDPN